MYVLIFQIKKFESGVDLKEPIATFYCDVPTEKVIFKGEQTHVRI